MDTLELLHQKAIQEKDTLLLGQTALRLSQYLVWKEGVEAEYIELMILAVECFQTVGDSVKYFDTRNELAEYYERTDLIDDALLIYKDAERYYKKVGNKVYLMHMKARIGRLYHKLGASTKGKKLLKESRKLNEILQDTVLELTFLIEDFNAFHQKGALDSAFTTAQRMLKLSEAIDNPIFRNVSFLNLGIVEFERGNYNEAIFYLKKTGQTAQPIEYSENRKVSLSFLAKCYEEKGQYGEALKYERRYSALNDSILEKGRFEALNSLTRAYEGKEKQAVIDLLEQEKAFINNQNRQKTLFLWLAGLGLVVLLVLLGVLFRFYNAKIKQEKIINDQKEVLSKQTIQTLEKEMRLESVQAMLKGQEKERLRIARDLHDSMGGLLSAIKLRLGKSEIADVQEVKHLLEKATKEVRNISQNLQPKSLEQFGLIATLQDLVNLFARTPNAPTIELMYYDIPENLNNGKVLQIYRIIQEAVQNAIKHADAQEIIIQLNGEPNGLSIVIEDDGKGFDTTIESTGNGLENIKKRAEFLDADLSIESNKAGTTVYLMVMMSTN